VQHNPGTLLGEHVEGGAGNRRGATAGIWQRSEKPWLRSPSAELTRLRKFSTPTMNVNSTMAASPRQL
jgi:hypothetical protein